MVIKSHGTHNIELISCYFRHLMPNLLGNNIRPLLSRGRDQL